MEWVELRASGSTRLVDLSRVLRGERVIWIAIRLQGAEQS